MSKEIIQLALREAVSAADEIGCGVVVVMVDPNTGKTACASNLTKIQGQRLLAFAAQHSLNPIQGAAAPGDWRLPGANPNDGARIGQSFENGGRAN